MMTLTIFKGFNELYICLNWFEYSYKSYHFNVIKVLYLVAINSLIYGESIYVL